MALYAEFPEDFAPESEPLFVRIDSLDVPLWWRAGSSVAEPRPRWRSSPTGIRRGEASELVGLELFVEPMKSVPTMSSIWRI